MSNPPNAKPLGKCRACSSRIKATTIAQSIQVTGRFLRSRRKVWQCGHCGFIACGRYHLAFGGQGVAKGREKRPWQAGQRWGPDIGVATSSASQWGQTASVLASGRPQLAQNGFRTVGMCCQSGFRRATQKLVVRHQVWLCCPHRPTAGCLGGFRRVPKGTMSESELHRW